VRRAVRVPLMTIAENAGLEGAIVARKIEQSKDPAFGYDAEKEKYGDMFAAGVIDPAKVTRTALQNAVSVATLLLNSGCMVADIPEPKPATPPGGGHGGMGGMGGMDMGM